MFFSDQNVACFESKVSKVLQRGGITVQCSQMGERDQTLMRLRYDARRRHAPSLTTVHGQRGAFSREALLRSDDHDGRNASSGAELIRRQERQWVTTTRGWPAPTTPTHICGSARSEGTFFLTGCRPTKAREIADCASPQKHVLRRHGAEGQRRAFSGHSPGCAHRDDGLRTIQQTKRGTPARQGQT